jgi:hypothetical protein
MTLIRPGADIRGFYTALGIPLPGWSTANAPTSCFADPRAHTRSDQHPSTSVDLITGAWCCHGCGATGGAYDAALTHGHTPRSAIELMITHRLIERRAQLSTARELITTGSQAAPVRPNRRARQVCTDLDVRRWQRALSQHPAVIRRLAHIRGWTRGAIDELQLGLDRGRVTIPIRDQTGRLVSLLRYQPGAKIKMRAAPGSRRVLYPHPAAVTDRRLLLVEGEPDRIAAHSHHLPAIAIPGVDAWQADWANLLVGHEVVIVLDCDHPGRACAQIIAQQLHRTRIPVEVLDLDPSRQDGYDLTNWLLDHPTRSETLLRRTPPGVERP